MFIGVIVLKFDSLTGSSPHRRRGTAFSSCILTELQVEGRTARKYLAWVDHWQECLAKVRLT